MIFKKIFSLKHILFFLSLTLITVLFFFNIITSSDFLLLCVIIFLVVSYPYLLQNQNKLEILDYTGYGIIKITLKNGVVFANKYALKTLGYKYRELKKSFFHEVVEEGFNNDFNKKIKKIYFSKNNDNDNDNDIFKQYKNNYRSSAFIDTDYFIRKDGSKFSVEYIIIPILSKKNIVSLVITFRDTTERRIMQDKLLKITEELKVSNKELESFSYSVSHDLRAPLRHISGFINLLNENEVIKSDEEANRYIDVILKSSKKMGDLIDDLLIFSRVSRSELQKSKVDLNEVVHELQNELCLFRKDEKRVNWIIEQLPFVMADKKMIRLVLMNLMSNAIKFTKYKKTPKISISSDVTEKDVIIKITDNGVGFEQKYVDKMFGVFQRLHKDSEFEGTGIGLANVLRIISRHNGKVWAIGSPNEGASFFISLPKKEV